MMKKGTITNIITDDAGAGAHLVMVCTWALANRVSTRINYWSE